MARSDVRPASDDVMRAIVHELAEAAPPAPDWDTLAPNATIRSGSDDVHRSVGARRMLLVAAAALLVVGGLWYTQRPDDPVPADVPADPTVAPDATLPLVEEGLADLDPVAAQSCLTRRNARLVLDNGLLALEGRESLPGFTVDRSRLTAFRPMVTAWLGIVEHPDLATTESADLAIVLDTYLDADAQAFAGPEGSEGAGFGAAVDAVEDELVTYLDRFDDPVECQPPDRLPTTNSVYLEGECVALWRLRDAVAAFASTGGADDDRVVETAAEALQVWPERVVAEYVELGDQIGALLAEEAADREPTGVLDAIEDLLVSRATDDCDPAPSASAGATSQN